MSTVMYDDVVDVEQKGYVAISHVWGDRQMYTARELGINRGVDWMIPLSRQEKLEMVTKGMSYFKKEYCWWDVLCMPQNKQDEINMEIPYMGDYYRDASMTFVLSSAKKRFLHTPIDTYLMNKINMAESSGYIWTRSAAIYMNVVGDEWFTRVWTYQEAMLSKNMIFVGPNHTYLKLSQALDTLADKRIKEPMSAIRDEDKTDDMIKLHNAIKVYKDGKADLVAVLSKSMKRYCGRPQDRFYGVLGILGYTTFSVDYNMDEHKISLEIAKYAYSKGDISWLSVDKNPAQLDVPFGHLGTNWKEGTPRIRNISIGKKTFGISACTIGTISRSTRWNGECRGISEFALRGFKEWGFNMTTTRDAIAVDREIATHILDSFMYISRYGYTNDAPSGEYSTHLKNYLHVNENMKFQHMLNREEFGSLEQSIAVILHNGTGKQQPVIVCGKPDLEDKAIVLNVRDTYGRALGIIVDKAHRRKGVFLHTRANMGEELYKLHRFPL